jgi:hypothetical protein
VKQQHFPESIDPKLYPNRWIAVVRGRVVGVGLTAQQAYRAAKQTRRKDKPQLFFVDAKGKVEPGGHLTSVDE